jgi:bifunctional UDP-N-acetylglucosamine pyrophosphorylase / glucosamine-1-phosphate N-acetyltransferase
MVEHNNSSLAIILAAGEGTRMKSSKPKVLHEIAGRSMLGHVLAAVKAAKIARIVVVIGPGREDVATQIKHHAPNAEIIVQTERLGTAHAVLHARAELEQKPKSVVVLFADTPLISSQTIQNMLEAVDSRNAVAALGFYADNPTGYGRLLMSGIELNAIREHKDASDKEREVAFCNAGLMALSGEHALQILSEIGNENAQKEYYLPDAVEVARAHGLNCVALEADSNEVLGVNDRLQLSQAEAVFQTRLRDQHMRNGVTLHAPETVFFRHDTQIATDVVIEPHVVFGEDVNIETGCTIKAFSHIDGATLGKAASVGPFARLRPGANLGANSKIGNFVEIKASNIGANAKVSHLSYIGDAEIGADANIGAGTITCNYDGYNKFKTIIGAGAFIGSNSSLVAPVTIGAGAYVGSGSVITYDVPDNALGVARGKQIVKLGWGEAFRNKL